MSGAQLAPAGTQSSAAMWLIIGWVRFIFDVPSADQSVRRTLRSVDSGQLLRSFVGHKGRVTALSFSLDGATLASGAVDRTVRLWNVISGESRHTISVLDDVRGVALSPDGKYLAESDQSMTIGLYDAKTGEAVHRFGSRRHDPPRTLVFSPDSKLLATADASDTIVNLWVIPDGRLLQYSNMPDVVRSVTFLPEQTESLAIPLCEQVRLVPYRSVDVEHLIPSKLLAEAENKAGMRIRDGVMVPLEMAASKSATREMPD